MTFRPTVGAGTTDNDASVDEKQQCMNHSMADFDDFDLETFSTVLDT